MRSQTNDILWQLAAAICRHPHQFSVEKTLNRRCLSYSCPYNKKWNEWLGKENMVSFCIVYTCCSVREKKKLYHPHIIKGWHRLICVKQDMNNYIFKNKYFTPWILVTNLGKHGSKKFYILHIRGQGLINPTPVSLWWWEIAKLTDPTSISDLHLSMCITKHVKPFKKKVGSKLWDPVDCWEKYTMK